MPYNKAARASGQPGVGRPQLGKPPLGKPAFSRGSYTSAQWKIPQKQWKPPPLPNTPPPTGYDWAWGRVTDITDGDTLHFAANNTTYNFRLGGIDTPELGKKGDKNEFYAVAARKHLFHLVEEQTILALFTTRPTTFNRHLAFLSDLQNNSINERMVADGFAFATRGFTLPQHGHFQELEAQAKRQKLGIWQDPPPISPELKRLLPDFSFE